MSRSAERSAAITAVLPGIVGVGAIALGAPDWLAATLLGVGPLVVVAAFLLLVRRPEWPRADGSGTVDSYPPASVWAIDVVTPESEAANVPRCAIGYVLLDPGDGQLARRNEEIRLWCSAYGLQLHSIVHDTEPPGEQSARPSLQWALARIAAGEASTLVVAELADLASSLATLSPLLRWFTQPGRVLVAIDRMLDTGTREGRLAADAVADVGTWERQRISARTRGGLEAARSRGEGLGRGAVADVPELRERIASMRDDGMTLQAIADVLNAEGVSTVRGGAMWRPSSVQRATGYRRPAAAPGGTGLPDRSNSEAL